MKFPALVALVVLLPSSALAWPTLSVTGVSLHDVLNLRAQPDAKSPRVASLPRDATGISADAVAVKGVDWIHISKDGKSGWANARFLTYEHGLPLRLSCSGTEPFWSVEMGYGRGDADLSFADTKQVLALDAPVVARARPDLWSVSSVKGRDFLLIEKTVCSDGMSDRGYPYTVAVHIGANLLSGCCR